MCARFSLATPEQALAEAFELADVPALQPRYNIAPGQPVAVVGRRDAAHAARMILLRWGLRRAPRPGRATGGLLVNARAESAHLRPAFRDALQRRRCLVPADGFFEWRREAGRKQPYFVHRADGGPLALAALWAPGRAADDQPACVILTTQPNEELRTIHDRMPVILPPAAWRHWLDPERLADDGLRALLRPAPDGALRVRPVSTWVNDARHDDPRCLAPV